MDTYERMNLEMSPIIRGDTFGHDVEVTGAEAGDTLYMTLKENVDDTDENAVAMVVHPITQAEIDAAEPIELLFSPDVMATIDITRHWCDVQIILSDSRVYTLISGSAVVIPDITRHSSTAVPPAGITVIETWSTTSFTVESA